MEEITTEYHTMTANANIAAIQKSEPTTITTGRDQHAASPWSYRPDADVYESANEFTIVLDMAGTTRDQLDLTLEDGTLTVHGRVSPRYPEGARCYRAEYGVGDYHRRFNLGEKVDHEHITADWTDGVLTVHLPKVDAAKPRRIAVK
jgi:HSP20 family protein